MMEQKIHETKRLYLDLSQTSMVELFAKIVTAFQPLTISAKISNTDVWLGSKYVFETKIYKWKIYKWYIFKHKWLKKK